MQTRQRLLRPDADADADTDKDADIDDDIDADIDADTDTKPEPAKPDKASEKPKKRSKKGTRYFGRITKTTKSPVPSVMKGQEVFCLLISGAFRDTSIDR